MAQIIRPKRQRTCCSRWNCVSTARCRRRTCVRARTSGGRCNEGREADSPQYRALIRAIATFRNSRYAEKGDSWQDIELKGYDPISDEALTYAHSVVLRKWNADYLSFRSEAAEQPVPSDSKSSSAERCCRPFKIADDVRAMMEKNYPCSNKMLREGAAHG
jgi:hypothetical protein